MRTSRMLLGTLTALGCLAATEGTARADLFKGGVGVIGAFGGNFLDKSDRSAAISPSYPGFGGITGGFGLALDARFLGLVGVEIDIIRMTNKGHANIDVNGRSLTLNIQHDAWHIPVMLKGSLPLPLMSPYIVVGAEFVRTSDAAADVTDNAYAVGARTSNYTFFTAGLGLEIKLPIPAVDIRIPFSLRGSYYNMGDDVQDRGEFTSSKFTYDTRWKWQALATLGAQYYF